MIDLKLHHIGYAVKNISNAEEYYINLMGYQKDFEVICEEINGKASFLIKDDVYLELVQAFDSSKPSPVDKIIHLLGGGTYHQCYQTKNIEQAVWELEKKGFIRYRRKFLYCHNMKTIFMITPDNCLIELMELIEINN